MASKLVGERVLAEFYANLLAVVGEGFIEDRLKGCGRHLVLGSMKRYAGLGKWW